MTNTRTYVRALGLALILALILVALPLQGQTPPGMQPSPEVPSVDEEELEDFVDAYLEVQDIQITLDQRMNERVQESDLEEERFSEINQLAQQSDQTSELPGVDAGELAEYERLYEDLLSIQDESQSDMVAAVESEDLTVDRFNEIIFAIQQDPELTDRAQRLLTEKAEDRES